MCVDFSRRRREEKTRKKATDTAILHSSKCDSLSFEIMPTLNHHIHACLQSKGDDEEQEDDVTAKPQTSSRPWTQQHHSSILLLDVRVWSPDLNKLLISEERGTSEEHSYTLIYAPIADDPGHHEHAGRVVVLFLLAGWSAGGLLRLVDGHDGMAERARRPLFALPVYGPFFPAAVTTGTTPTRTGQVRASVLGQQQQ